MNIKNKNITKIIGLVAPGHKEYAQSFYGDVDHLVVECNDIDIDQEVMKPPTMDHIMEIINYAGEMSDDDRVLVHCHAGVSRSTAGALAVLLTRGETVEDAIQHIIDIRPVASTNRLMVRQLGTIFGDHIYGHVIDKIWHMDTNERRVLRLKDLSEDMQKRETDAANASVNELTRLMKIMND